MSSVDLSSPVAAACNEVNLRILSFLDDRSLQNIACVSKQFNSLARDFRIWKPRTELEFGAIVAFGAKQPNKSWKQTYDELASSKKARIENIAKVVQSHRQKISTDDIQHRTARAASALFGFAAPNPSTRYYPTGQTGFLGGHKITVYKITNL